MTVSHRVMQQDAFVLHSYPYRESSLLLEVFSRQHGRFGAIARGTRNSRSHSRVLLQPFQPLSLSWSGKGDLHTITTIEPRGAAYRFNADNLMSAFYINELLIKLLHRHDPHEDLFGVYENVLADFSFNAGLDSMNTESRLRLFEKRLMEELGYGLSFTEIQGEDGNIDDEGVYGYVPGHGVVPVADGKLRLSGRTLRAIADESLMDRQVLKEAKQLMKCVIEHYLGNSNLNTRNTLISMNSLMKNINKLDGQPDE
jgi:DNA repair protein RecO (recombination protein O)